MQWDNTNSAYAAAGEPWYSTAGGNYGGAHSSGDHIVTLTTATAFKLKIFISEDSASTGDHATFGAPPSSETSYPNTYVTMLVEKLKQEWSWEK